MKKGVFAVGCVGFVVAAIQISCTCAPCQDVQKNKELVLDSLAAVQAQEFDTLDQFYAADFVRHCQMPGGDMSSLQQFKDYLIKDLEAFPNPEYKIVHLVAENDLVSFWASYSAVNEGPVGDLPATGKRVKIDFAGTHRIADGKIVETWVTWDNQVAMTQLGFWPPEKPSEETTAE
jgi:predicted ester cyclase